MRHHLLAIALLVGVAGCASTLPPERLVAVTQELTEAESQELAESQPGLVREARDHRDAGWEALDRGSSELAETHAWVSWLKLRTAENLEAISQRQALLGAAETAPVAAAGRSDVTAESRTTAGQREADVRGRSDSREGEAARAVREAEDAKLRLLSAGLEPDLRWAEADALLQVAERALERGESARAEELGRRAAFVYEVVRLTRLGGTGAIPLVEGVSAEDEIPGAPSALPSEPAEALGEQLPAAEVPLPVPVEGGTPTVVVVPGATPAPTDLTPATEEEPAERPRSRIISYILQPLED